MSTGKSTFGSDVNSARNQYVPTWRYEMFIDGKWTKSSERFEIVDPSIGKVWTDLPQATPSDVELAVRSARKAFGSWKHSTLGTRQSILDSIADRVVAHEELWASLLPTENGRPVREVYMADIPATAAIFRYFAGIVRDFRGDQIPVEDPNSLIYTLREPLGVIAALIPWNSPIITLANKLAPALATGNTIVIKPSEYASASVLEFIKLISDLLPPGVINVITGFGSESGAALVSNPGVSKITLTGGPQTAMSIMQAAAKNLTPSLMELGGKSCMIVCPDANLENAVWDAITGIFLANGEACIASSRLLLHSGIATDFLDRFIDTAGRIKIGDALDPHTQMGPMVSKVHKTNVLNHLRNAREEGAEILLGGDVTPDLLPLNQNGFFVAPTLIFDPEGSTKISRTEVFGPATVAETFTDIDDAINRANDTRYGLAAGVWTNDLQRAHKISARLDAGIVWVNKWFDLPAGAPMGGVKRSGFGRELSVETLSEYSTTKVVNIDLGSDRPPIWG